MATLAPKSKQNLPPISECSGRIGVFRALHLGDILCAVPAWRALRKLCPNAHITFIGLPESADIAHRFRCYIDEFLPFPGHPQLPESQVNSGDYQHFLQTFPKNFDWLIQLHGDGRKTNAITGEWGARRWAGFVPYGHPETDTAITYPPGHEIDRLLALIEALGGCGSPDLEFPLSGDDFGQIRNEPALAPLLNQEFAIVHPGGRGIERRLPAELFTEIVEFLAARTRVVLTGGLSEREANNRIAGLIPRVTNAAGMTSLGMLAALISKARCLVANDTGPSHLSAALKTPSLVLFSGSDPSRWAPKDSLLHRIVDARLGIPRESLWDAMSHLWDRSGGS